MVKILRYNQFLNEMLGEFRKGSERYGSLVDRIMMYLRTFDIDKSKPLRIPITTFTEKTNTNIKELKDFINDNNSNLISFKIQIENDYIHIMDLDKAQKNKNIH